MHSLKKLAGQTAVYGMSSIIGRFLNYLLTPLYTYQFVAKDYGVVTEMYAYVAFLVVLLTYGMETAFFRFSSKNDNSSEVYNTAVVPVATTAFIFMVLAIFFSDSLAQLIQYPDHPEFITYFAIIVSLDAFSSIPLAKLRLENKAVRFATINLSSIAMNIALNLFFIGYCKVLYDSGQSNYLVETFYKPEIGVGYIFISNLAASIFKFLLLSPFIIGIKLRLNIELFRKMLIYALPLLLAGLAGIANENLDRILLKYLLIEDLGIEETMTQVGIYGACYKVSILITLFVQAYRYAAEPFFFSKAKESDAAQTYADMMKYFVIICLLIFLFLMFNIDWVMLFVGEEYRAGVEIVPLLLLANIFLGIFYNLSVWYKLTDKTMTGAYIAGFGAFVIIVFNLLLIPVMGYVGSAVTTLICYALMAMISFIIGRKHYPIPYQIQRLAIYFLGAILIFFMQINLPLIGTTKIIVSNMALLIILVLVYNLERPKKIII